MRPARRAAFDTTSLPLVRAGRRTLPRRQPASLSLCFAFASVRLRSSGHAASPRGHGRLRRDGRHGTGRAWPAAVVAVVVCPSCRRRSVTFVAHEQLVGPVGAGRVAAPAAVDVIARPVRGVDHVGLRAGVGGAVVGVDLVRAGAAGDRVRAVARAISSSPSPPLTVVAPVDAVRVAGRVEQVVAGAARHGVAVGEAVHHVARPRSRPPMKRRRRPRRRDVLDVRAHVVALDRGARPPGSPRRRWRCRRA